MKFLASTLFALSLSLLVSCSSSLDVATIPQNQEVISAINKMPRGGGYSVRAKAFDQLSSSVKVYQGGGLKVSPSKAKPSFCSSATYLVLLEMVEAAVARGEFTLTEKEALALAVYGQADGHGIWGRWNANGPGAAKLIKDLGMGINFESYAKAQPGDFMKIFWTEEVGKKEFGHLVVYLGTYQRGGKDYVRFWSSNQPRGYGVKSVAKEHIKWAVFSRITNLKNIKRVDNLSSVDRYLVNMLKRKYSHANVRRCCAVRG